MGATTCSVLSTTTSEGLATHITIQLQDAGTLSTRLLVTVRAIARKSFTDVDHRVSQMERWRRSIRRSVTIGRNSSTSCATIAAKSRRVEYRRRIKRLASISHYLYKH